MGFVLRRNARSAWFHGGYMYARREAKRRGVVGRARKSQREKTLRVFLSRLVDSCLHFGGFRFVFVVVSKVA